MKTSRFIIFYSCGDCQSVMGFTMYQAVITAQSSRISAAKDFTIESIKDENGKLYTIDNQMSFKRNFRHDDLSFLDLASDAGHE